MAKSKATKLPENRENAERRTGEDRRQQNVPVEVERRQGPRRKVQRRRQIDPTTCERDYTNDEVEFMQALDLYKRDNGRMFPTCSEILEVIRSLGYQRVPPAAVEQTESSQAGQAGEFDESETLEESIL